MLSAKLIGQKITHIRKNNNLSQAQLAERLFISPQAVGKWERGESLPDIITLNSLANLVGVDLNYFSGNAENPEMENALSTENQSIPATLSKKSGKKIKWDLSKLNLVNSDFSGLKNLQEKLSSANIQNCLFIDSDLSQLSLSNNNVESCDFSKANMSGSHIQHSMLSKNKFNGSLLVETEFNKNYINECDFSNTDLTKTTFKSGYFMKNTIAGAQFNETHFTQMGLHDIVFEGKVENCLFENCSFFKVSFQNVTLLNTFFKNNRKFKRVQFTNCKADKLTYAFLKNNQADMTGIELIA